MNEMLYKEININKFLYKILITDNFNSKSMKFHFKSVKNKEGQTSRLALPTLSG